MDPMVQPTAVGGARPAGAGPDASGTDPSAAEPSASRRPSPVGTPRRRWTLRARLIALVVATAAVALVAVDIVLPLIMRDAAISTKDATLSAATAAAQKEYGRLTGEILADLTSGSGLKGEVGWSTITQSGITQV